MKLFPQLAFLLLVLPILFCSASSAQVPPATPDCGPANNSDLTKGVVWLRVVLLASGKVGDIEVISAIPNGMTDEAIAAAKQVKFEPQKVNGQPVDTVKTFEYRFEILYDEDSPDLQISAKITKLPKPKFPKKAADHRGQKIAVIVELNADGTTRVFKVNGDFPQEIKDAAEKAAAKIEFQAAIHKCGVRVSESRTIEFEIQ